MVKTLPNLLAIAQVTRIQSQRYLKFRLYTNYLSVILSCVSLAFPINIGWIIILLAGILQATSIILKNYANRYHNFSREIQRMALLENSFGKNIENFNISDLYAEIDEKLLQKAREYNFGGDYYSSKCNFGYNRFKENIQESCFFSRNLIDLEKRRIKVKVALMISLIVIITFVFLIIDVEFSPDFRYILGGVSIVLFFIINDDIETYSNCTGAYKLFKDVNLRLNNLQTKEELFSAFADYSVASLLSPPISTYLYNRKRDLLDSVWEKYKDAANKTDQVQVQEILSNKKEELLSETSSIDINWVVNELKNKFIKSNNRIKYKVNKLEGWSGSPVYEILFYENSKRTYHLIAKFYKDSFCVKKELDYIEKLRYIGTDLLCFTICEGDFALKNVIVYYHASHQTQMPMKTLKEYICSIFNNSEKWNIFCSSTTSFIESVTETFDKLEGDYYKVSTYHDYLEKKIDELPPSFILDLTGDSRFKFVEKDFIISSKQSYPDLEMLDQLYIIGYPELKSICKNDIKYEWVKILIEIEYVYKLPDRTYIYSQINNSNNYICIIVPTEIYNSKIKSHISQDSFYLIINPYTSRFSTFDVFFKNANNLEANCLQWEKIETFLDHIATKEIKLSTRHGDFHDKNILCADNHFKIIDIGDIGIYPIAYDVARLEVSILLSLTENTLYSNVNIVDMYINMIKNKNISISEQSKKIEQLINSIRKGLNKGSKYKIDLNDYLVLVYLELLSQIGYSIFGFKKISPQIISLQDFLYKHITENQYI